MATKYGENNIIAIYHNGYKFDGGGSATPKINNKLIYSLPISYNASIASVLTSGYELTYSANTTKSFHIYSRNDLINPITSLSQLNYNVKLYTYQEEDITGTFYLVENGDGTFHIEGSSITTYSNVKISPSNVKIVFVDDNYGILYSDVASIISFSQTSYTGEFNNGTISSNIENSILNVMSDITFPLSLANYSYTPTPIYALGSESNVISIAKEYYLS